MTDRDLATGTIANVLGMVAIAGTVLLPALMYSHPTMGNASGDRIERQWVRQDLETILETGDRWCCPDDPSSPSRLQDALASEWASDEGEFERLFERWLSVPESTSVRLRVGWQPASGAPLERVPVYGPEIPDGPTVGSQRWIRPSPQGPAYLVPRLENVSNDASADFHFVPMSKWWPYRQGLSGEHGDGLDTRVHFQATGETVEDYPVVIREHTEIAGTPVPAVDVSFEEPDWTEMPDNPIATPEDASEPSFRLALTKEDLSKERVVDGVPGTSAETGVYAHHRFRVNVAFKGDTTRNLSTLAENQPQWSIASESHKFQVEVKIPRKWSEISFKAEDRKANKDSGWIATGIRALSGGAGHRVTAVLNETINYTLATKEGPDGSPERFAVELEEPVVAPFTFHARPPAETESTVAGFQQIEARVTSGESGVRGTATLGVELANNAGRLHRSIEVHAPQHWPPLAFGGTERTVEVPIGVSFFNGGEPTEVTRVSWSAPEGTFDDASTPETLTSFGADAVGRWEVGEDGDRIAWSGSAECPEMEACTLAARVRLDGSQLEPARLWDLPRATGLYDADDVRSYVDWFVRSDRGWRGALDAHGPPGFAMASRTVDASGGAVDGGFLWTLPPSTEPVCSEDDVDERDRASRGGGGDGRDGRDGGGDRTVYRFGPREDGIPVVGTRTDPDADTDADLDADGDGGADAGEDVCSAGPGANRTFEIVGQTGARSSVEAVGHGSYRSVEGLSRRTFTSWRNGLAESRIEGPDSVAPGATGEFHVIVDGLFDRLLDQGISEVDVRALVYDPYNAWEREPWWGNVLWDRGRPHVYQTELPGEDTVWIEGSGDPCEERECPDAPLPGEVGSHDPVPSKFDLGLTVPERTLPGTHLLVVEVSWQASTDAGEAFRETGRLLKPFDVLFGGSRAMPTMVEGVAWSEDWG